MPVIFRIDKIRFFFYSNEGDPREPVHVHVRPARDEAKFWLRPVRIAENHGFDARALRMLIEHVEANSLRIEEAWNEFFG